MEKMPASAPQPAQPHAALIWLIRGTGAILAIPSAMLIIFAVVVMPIMIIINPHRPAFGWMEIGIGFSIMILGLLFYGFIAKIGFDMFRKVNATTIANFAFIFSFLTAHTLYHVLPLNLPNFLVDHVGKDAIFFGQGTGPEISYRATLAFFAFLIFYNVLKAYLLRVLELNAPIPPQNPPSSAPDDPFVPFDPYDLSKNGPLRPL
jgi:hypothetical protein